MKKPLTGDLGTILGFDQSDLSLNRTGVMSRRQAARLRHLAIVRFVQMGMLIAVPVALAAAMASSGLVDGYESLEAKALLMFEASLALLGLVAAWVALRNMGDARDRRVEVDEGYVACISSSETRGHHHYYYYRTMRRQYRVPKAACQALDKHQRYRIYIAPRTKTLLTIEPHGR